MGDFDNDVVTDIAVGANEDDDGMGNLLGAVWILFLNDDGTVKSFQKISATEGNFGGELETADLFGTSVLNIGDFDHDGISDLAVGAPQDNDVGDNRGAIWILFMNDDGTVKSFQKISQAEGNFGGSLINGENFGYSLAKIGSLNGDDIPELASGARGSNDGGPNNGAVWILFMNKIQSPVKPVGGEIIPIESTSLILAGTQLTASWLIPVIVSAVGIGLVFVRRK